MRSVGRLIALRQFSIEEMIPPGGYGGAGEKAIKKLRAALAPDPRTVIAASDIPTYDDDLQGAIFNRAGGVALTAPAKTRDPSIEPGYEFPIWNIGAGDVIVAKEGPDTLLSDGSKTRVAHARVACLQLISQAPNGARTWLLVGGLS